MLTSVQMNIYCLNRIWSMTRRGQQLILVMDHGEMWAMDLKSGLWICIREQEEEGE